MGKTYFQKKAEETAIERMKIISPLIEEGLDKDKRRQLLLLQCQKYGVSERTVGRYLDGYQKSGYQGLYPVERKNTVAEGISEEVINAAIMLRREVPSRSVPTIIKILELEGMVEEGELKRTTLQDKLARRGYSARQMKVYSSNNGLAVRRFSKKRRMHLVHSDIKYGLYLPIGPNGAKQQVYLVIMQDDSSRYLLHGRFYATLDQTIVQESLRMAILKYGLMESVFFDNGPQYRTKWMERACGKLGIRLLYARPYSPEATGKPEKFNKYVDNFLAEAALEKVKTLKEFNELFEIWLSECYQNKPHAALGGKTPQGVFESDPTELRYVAPETIADAFMHYEERKVDKVGCISFSGKKYEVGLKYVGCRVGVAYDPMDITQITIEYKGDEPFTAKEMVMGTNTGQRPKLPERLQKVKPTHSRLLAGMKKKNGERASQKKSRRSENMILSFRTTKDEGKAAPPDSSDISAKGLPTENLSEGFVCADFALYPMVEVVQAGNSPEASVCVDSTLEAQETKTLGNQKLTQKVGRAGKIGGLWGDMFEGDSIFSLIGNGVSAASAGEDEAEGGGRDV